MHAIAFLTRTSIVPVCFNIKHELRTARRRRPSGRAPMETVTDKADLRFLSCADMLADARFQLESLINPLEALNALIPFESFRADIAARRSLSGTGGVTTRTQRRRAPGFRSSPRLAVCTPRTEKSSV